MSSTDIFINRRRSDGDISVAISQAFNVGISQIEIADDWQKLKFETEIVVTTRIYNGEFSLRINLSSRDHPLIDDNDLYKLGYLCELLDCQGVNFSYPEDNINPFIGVLINGRYNYNPILINADKDFENKEIALDRIGRQLSDISEWTSEDYKFLEE